MCLQPYNKTSRKDGRSDGRVIYDLAVGLKPNEVLTYDILLNALQEGINDVEFNKNRVYGAIKSANRKLLKNHNRYLAVIRREGYKMITAEEHLSVALAKKQSAQKNMQSGLEILEHTVLEELKPTHRILHEQQMMLMKSLYQRVKFHDEKINETENIIGKMRADQQVMLERLEQLEKR
jgi:hypothetical protein